MELTREIILKERAIAEEGKDKARAELNAYIGAVNAFNHLLTLLDKPNPAPQAPAAAQPSASQSPSVE